MNHTGWQRTLQFILPYLAIILIFQLLGSLAVGVDPMELDMEKTSFQEFIIVLFNLIGTILALWIFAVKKDQTKFVSLGFHIKQMPKELCLGFGMGVLAIVSGFFLLIEILIEKNSILNGGSFGFEESIFSIVIQLVIIIGVVFIYRQKKST